MVKLDIATDTPLKMSAVFPWDAFIAHAGMDKGLAEVLHKALEAQGVHTFLDKFSAVGGDITLPVFESYVASSRIVIVLVTRFLASTEWAMADRLGQRDFPRPTNGLRTAH